MPVSRRKRVEVERRREQTAQLYLAGNSQDAIADRLGVSQGTVSLDLKALRKQWQERASATFSQRQAEELARLHDLERLARDSFARSCRPLGRQSAPRPGNEKLLMACLRAVELRMRAQGMLSGETSISLQSINIDWAVLHSPPPRDPIAERLAEAERLALPAPLVIDAEPVNTNTLKGDEP